MAVSTRVAAMVMGAPWLCGGSIVPKASQARAKTSFGLSRSLPDRTAICSSAPRMGLKEAPHIPRYDARNPMIELQKRP